MAGTRRRWSRQDLLTPIWGASPNLSEHVKNMTLEVALLNLLLTWVLQVELVKMMLK